MKNHYPRFKFRSLLIASALTFTALSAFAGTVLPYTLKTQSSQAVGVESIHAMQNNDKILVSGRLRISPAYSDSTSGHLCVTVISPNGKILSDTPISYNKNLRGKNLNEAQWKVSYVISVSAAPGSTIVVSHHNSSLSSCKALHQET